MTTVIRLDRSLPFSECHGERTTDDPHYRVKTWQGAKLKNGMTVLLPFDTNDMLIEDDGKTEPWTGMNVDSKPVTHHPLYNEAMRKLVAAKRAKLAAPVVEDAAAGFEPVEDDGAGVGGDDVNFASWLRGEVQYDWAVLVVAASKRFGRKYTSKKSMVEDLVIDEKVIPEDQLCKAFQPFLPTTVAA